MKKIHLITVFLTLALILAACGGAANQASTEPTQAPEPTAAAEQPAEPEPTEAPQAAEPTAAPEEPASDSGEMSGLAAVCPNPIVIQTDWFPEAEHGALYQ
ncbi:MAG: hypothetical protein D6768_12700, partial [Chloroflexi bacterium]